MIRETAKTAGVYLLSIGLLSYYGIEVCPFLESMTAQQLIGVHAVAFLIGFACRMLLVYRLHCQEAAPDEWEYEIDLERPWKYLQVDLGCWLLIGLLVTAWNSAVYDFPVGSGLKVVLGCLTLGVFTSTCLALDIERELIRCLSAADKPAHFKAGRFLSITTKFLLFIGLCIGVICMILLLLIYKDFQFVIEQLTSDQPFHFSWIVREVLFVFAVLFTGTVIVLRKYSRNLRLMFDLQLNALGAVGGGNYETFVPVVSRDEFSVIAEQTNGMIAGLREKERVKKIFGKYVSGPIAQEILDQEGGDILGGREARAAVLFTDLRNFTPFSERCSPQEVVQVLNQYFSMVVDAIHRHRGILDKFIGDAAMGVFGLDGGEKPCTEAVAAAADIRRGLAALNQRLAGRDLPPLECGIGIHFGPLVAGNIGSRERMEYTVIGDTVNTASRLEQLTKNLPAPVALSEEVVRHLEKNIRSQLQHLGEHQLKGKAAPLPVFGMSDR